MAAAAAGDERESKRACTAATTVLRQCWSSTFPDDLLAVVYSIWSPPRASACALPPSAGHGVRPRARRPPYRCHGCSTAPSSAPGTQKRHIVSIAPRMQRDVRVPLAVPGTRRLVGCHDGGWVVSSAPAPITIVNIFSGAEVKLGEKQGIIQHHDLDSVLKIVFSQPPTSGDCILATMTNKRCIGLTRVGSPECGWTMNRYSGMVLGDIMFYNNELYGLWKFSGELVKFEIGTNKDGAPVVIAEHRLAKSNAKTRNICRQNTSFIFDLDGKLAMARIRWSLQLETFFSVFQLVDIHARKLTKGYKHKWVKVTSLGDHALFLGQTFSKAVRVPVMRRGSVERNRIYFFHHHRYISPTPYHSVFLTISNESGHMEESKENNMANDEVKRIMSTLYTTQGCNHGGTWILPPDV
ncbi:unnamed protein product [Alopecurus aequalis]